jgi:DNA-binding GntR family transcriptional regulator
MAKALTRKIIRLELPQEAATRLRKLIVSGDLPPGFRLVERDIAERLGVSRTPVRQAFFALQDEGLVSSSEGRGLIVSPLDVNEITDIYQLIAALERTAIRHTAQISNRMLTELTSANRHLSAAGDDVSRIISADVSWHRALTGFSANRALRDLLESLRVRSERYERAFFRASSNRNRSFEDHLRIEELLKAGNFNLAADMVEAHWIDAISPMQAAARRA